MAQEWLHFFLLNGFRLVVVPELGLVSLLAPKVKPDMPPGGGNADAWAAGAAWL